MAVGSIGQRITGIAAWADRTRLRWPEFNEQGRPTWVNRALSEAAPVLAILAVVGVLHFLDVRWLSMAWALLAAAYVLLFGLFPWLVSIVVNFSEGYRGD